MRFFFFLICIGVIPSLAFAQAQTEYMTQTTRDRINFTNLSVTNNATLFSIKGPAGQLLGSPYLDTTWQAGNVKFYNRLGVSLTADSLAGVPVRLDLLAHEIEVRAGASNIKAVKATAVRYVDINNSFGTISRYINAHEYQMDGQILPGFFEQLVTGKLDLLLYPSAYIRRANYNMALNTGSKDDELMKKQDASPAHMGDSATANKRTIYKYIHAGGIQSCQLVMGLTVLEEGSVWNTMPAHTHTRRMEAYFYFDVPDQHRVFHFMG
ncbi:MAG: hypothetical protein EOO39_32615, partial [Cytophagaceae bacterium]